METSKRKRPLFITVLALLQIVVGGAFFFLAIISIFFPDYAPVSTLLFQDYPSELSEMSWFISFVYLVSSSLSFISGIGMWVGSKWWGWHLGTLYNAYNLFRNFNVLFFKNNFFLFLPYEIIHVLQGPNYFYYESIIRIALFGVIYIYFFSRNITKYFNIDPERNSLVILVHFLICIIITTILTAVSGQDVAVIGF